MRSGGRERSAEVEHSLFRIAELAWIGVGTDSGRSGSGIRICPNFSENLAFYPESSVDFAAVGFPSLSAARDFANYRGQRYRRRSAPWFRSARFGPFRRHLGSATVRVVTPEIQTRVCTINEGWGRLASRDRRPASGRSDSIWASVRPDFRCTRGASLLKEIHQNGLIDVATWGSIL